MAAWPLSEQILPSIGYGKALSPVELIRSFSLKPIDSPLPRSELFWEGNQTPLVVDGSSLEAQYRIDSRYLLLLTENCPYEEGLHIYLLDNAHRVLDGLELSVPYAPGTLKNLRALDNALTFSFFGEDHWRLDVLKVPTWNLREAWGGPITRKAGIFRRRWMLLSQASQGS